MKERFAQAKTLIDRSQRILLTTHERTDGDDFGSVIALAHHLGSSGKEIVMVIRGGVPYNLKFLAVGQKVLETVPDNFNLDLVIVSGCSTKQRIGNSTIAGLNAAFLNIDHHPDNTNYGTVNLVDHTKSAVAELVYDFFRFCGWNITPPVATALLTGIFTDTGSFMHSNTQDRTLKAAGELMTKGAHVNTVAKRTYRGKTIAGLKAWGKALENTFYDPEQQIIYSLITDEDLQDLDHISLDTFEGLVETLNKVPEAKMALFLKQDGGQIKGSVRSDPHKGVNVNQVAQVFGGGGHKWASGFSVAGKLIKDPQGKWQIV